MIKKQTRLFKLGIFVLLSAFLAACQPQDQAVNLYSARNETLIKPLLNEFTADTGIKVNIISSKADALLKRIESEGINSPADVLLTTDAGRLHRAKVANIFAPLNSSVINENIPSQYRDKDLMWAGLSIRVRPIMVTEAGKSLGITSYENLASPSIGKSICVRSSGNIYNQSLVAGMLNSIQESEAETWASGIVNNMARAPQGGDRDQIRAAAAGQCSVVIANTYYLANMLADQEKQNDYQAAQAMTVIWPNQNDRGAHVNISGAGILKTAPNKENALKLIEYLASEKAQRMYANVNFEYPAMNNIELNPILQQWGDFKADSVNLSFLGEKNSAAVKILDRAGWK